MAGKLVNVKATNDQKATIVENCLEMEEVDGCKEVSVMELVIANELYVTVMTRSHACDVILMLVVGCFA